MNLDDRGVGPWNLHFEFLYKCGRIRFGLVVVDRVLVNDERGKKLEILTEEPDCK